VPVRSRMHVARWSRACRCTYRSRRGAPAISPAHGREGLAHANVRRVVHLLLRTRAVSGWESAMARRSPWIAVISDPVEGAHELGDDARSAGVGVEVPAAFEWSASRARRRLSSRRAVPATTRLCARRLRASSTRSAASRSPRLVVHPRTVPREREILVEEPRSIGGQVGIGESEGLTALARVDEGAAS